MVTWLIAGVFVVMSALMITKRMSVLFALPVMALLIALVVGIPWGDTVAAGTTTPGISTLLFVTGPTRLAAAMMMMIFGAILAQMVKNTGIAEAMIRRVTEFAGDRLFVLVLGLLAVTSLLFTTLGGLGAVVMVGSIILPILLSVGLGPTIAGSIFLIGFSIGGIFNLANWGLYISALGLTAEQIRSFAFVAGGVFAVMAVAFAVAEVQFGGKLFGKGRVAWATPTVKSNVLSSDAVKINALAYLTPLIPLVLVMAFRWNIVAAFVAGILYCLITTINKDSMKTLTKSVTQGISDLSGVIFLLIGIGMLLVVVMSPRVTQHIGPAITAVLPATPIAYVVFFALLAPLALYRGPLNIWGLGLGVGALMMASGKLEPMAIMAALLVTGQIQGICDPTNTHNVWTAATVGVDVNDILKKTLPYVWVAVPIGLSIAAFMYF